MTSTCDAHVNFRLGPERYLRLLQRHPAELHAIARMRTGSHCLFGETGRWHSRHSGGGDGEPNDSGRLCVMCDSRVVEDPFHVFFVCPAYESVRDRHRGLLAKYKTLPAILSSDSDSLCVGQFVIDLVTLRSSVLAARG